MNYKEIVTTVKNDEIVQVLEHQNKLKKNQIEQIHLCLGKIKKNQKLLEIIWSDGIIGFEAFLSALEFAGSYTTLIDKIKRTKGMVKHCDISKKIHLYLKLEIIVKQKQMQTLKKKY